MADIRDDVVRIIKKLATTGTIGDGDDEKQLKELGVDSLDFSGILLELEERFDIRIPDEDINKLGTIAKIVEYVSSNKG